MDTYFLGLFIPKKTLYLINQRSFVWLRHEQFKRRDLLRQWLFDKLSKWWIFKIPNYLLLYKQRKVSSFNWFRVIWYRNTKRVKQKWIDWPSISIFYVSKWNWKESFICISIDFSKYQVSTMVRNIELDCWFLLK